MASQQGEADGISGAHTICVCMCRPAIPSRPLNTRRSGEVRRELETACASRFPQVSQSRTHASHVQVVSPGCRVRRGQSTRAAGNAPLEGIGIGISPIPPKTCMHARFASRRSESHCGGLGAHPAVPAKHRSELTAGSSQMIVWPGRELSTMACMVGKDKMRKRLPMALG